MNILFVYERRIIPTFGGVERVTFLLSEELRRRGHDVAFLSVGPEDWNREQVETGFPQFYLPSSEENFTLRFSSLLSDRGVEVIIFQGLHPAVRKTLSHVPHGIKKLLAYHNLPFSTHLKERFVQKLHPWSSLKLKGKFLKVAALIYPPSFRLMTNRLIASRYREVAKQVDKFLFLSDRFLPRVKELVKGIEAHKLGAINNPLTFRVPLQDELDNIEQQKENVVLFVGRLSNPQKNVTGFIDVWHRFSRLHPDWQALVVGDGEHAEYIRRYARKKRVERLSFEGNKPDVAQYYKRAKILCMTSSYEGWGMVLTEAMAYCCVPVLYDSYEAARDIVTSGSNGFLIPPFDKNEMVAALDLLASDQEMRLEMAASGRNKIQDFQTPRIVDKWEEIIQ